jgi:hypothetical protein
MLLVNVAEAPLKQPTPPPSSVAELAQKEQLLTITEELSSSHDNPPAHWSEEFLAITQLVKVIEPVHSIPPPIISAEFFMITQSFSFTNEFWSHIAPAPPTPAEFSTMLQLTAVSEQLGPQYKPPPHPSIAGVVPVTEFPTTMQSVMVMDESSQHINPPPTIVTELFAIVQLLTVTNELAEDATPPPECSARFCTMAQFLTVPEEAMKQIPPPPQLNSETSGIQAL